MELIVDPFQKRAGMPPSSPPSGGATGSTGFSAAFKPNMPMVPSKLPAPPTNVTTGGGSKVAGASTSKPMLKGIKGLGKTVSRSMMKKGGSVISSASKRADGIATKGKTKGRFV
jgi:hypothetical protein